MGSGRGTAEEPDAILKLLPMLLVVLLIAMPIVAVYANFYGNFDQDFSGVQNPPPWTFAQLNQTAPGIGNFSSSYNPNTFSGQTISGQYAASPPNVYLISYTGINSSRNYGCIYAYLNASTTYVVVNVYAYSQDNVSVASFFYFIGINDGNSTQWVSANATLVDASTSYGAYILLSGGLSVTPNSIITIEIGVEDSASSDHISHNFFFDNVSVQGANFSLWGASNFEMVDINTGSLFSITSYTNSRVIVSYSNGPQEVYTSLTGPTMNLTLGNATLITVWVGNAYERSIIPNPYAVNVMYLDNPNGTLPYQINVIDMTGHFGVGSKLFIGSSQYVQSQVITSGYTDAQSTFNTYLQPGAYGIQIQNETNTYIATIVLGSATSSVTLTIVNIAISSPGGLTTAVTYGTGWSGTDLITQMNDTTLSTTSLTWTLLQRTYAGTSAVASYYASGPYGLWDYSFDTSSIGLNASYAPQLFVTLAITDAYGSYTLGPFAVTVPFGSIFPTAPDFPNLVLGMSTIIPDSNAWVEFAAAIVMVIVAAAFASQAAPFGVLVVSVVGAFFGFAGWLPIGDSLISIIIPIAVVMVMVAKQRGSGH